MIEVAETTIRFDRSVKAGTYARAGLLEYWLVDLGRESVEVRLDPSRGRYCTLRVFRRGERLTPRVLPRLEIAVDSIFG